LLNKNEDNSAAKYIEARPIPNDLSDRQTQSRIQTWLRDCQKNHQCFEETAVPKLPTRVLDLSKSQPRLHISATNERSHYACLSYCWGGPQEVLTTKANLNENVKRLPIDRLPKTLQDAISVSKTLGLRFLWIDALCIIQNSQEDKAVEINKMGSIYRDATVTIFATSASRVGDGFLQYRSPDEGGVLLSFYVSDSTQGTVTLLLKDSPYTPNEPLDSRAWVVQETLLSRRRLIYGTKELLWKCQENDYQTVTVSPRSYNMLVTSLPGDIFSPTQDSDVKRQKEADNSHAESWSIIVKNFTSRGMTNREDRLPAIGGVAAELQRLWKDEYIVGTWRGTLAKHLMWYRLKSHPSASLPRPVKYRSPTWSWASVDCAVDFHPIEFVDVEIICCTVQLRSSLAPFGSAVGGELVLKAKVLTMTHMEPETVNGWRVTQDVESELIVDSNTVFVLLGFHNGRAYGINLKIDDDGNFLRTGSFSHEDNAYKFRGDRSCVWKRPEVTIQELRIF
jgi:hypothetical protein